MLPKVLFLGYFCSVRSYMSGCVAKIVLPIFLLSGSLFGQATTLGSVVGTVVDPSGAAVPGANVRVINTGTGVVREVMANDNGAFSVLSLIPGIYSVEVTSANFQKQVQENLRLEVAGSISLTFRLNVGQVSESVTVAAEAELLKVRIFVGGRRRRHVIEETAGIRIRQNEQAARPLRASAQRGKHRGNEGLTELD